MKRVYIILILSMSILSCTKDQKITFNNSEINTDNCENCPDIKINIPEANPANLITEKINTTLSEKITEIIDFSEDKEIENLEDAIRNFSDAYKELVKEFPESVKWEVMIDGNILTKNKHLVSFQLDSYMFTGGAHGYSATNFINFDLKTGEELAASDLIKDIKKFTLIAEKKFRKQENILLDKNINSTGFLFENDVFYLPENIGFTKDKVILVYNQYEIASYADGQKIIEIPLSQVRNMLNNF